MSKAYLDDENIYTVYQSLQDKYVAKNLEIDLGSLNQFIDLRSIDPTPSLPNLRMARKINRKVDQAPKKTSQVAQEKDTQNPKVIVENIFRDVFGMDVTEFEKSNSLPKLEREFQYQEVTQDKKKYLQEQPERVKLILGQELDSLPAKHELKLKIGEGTANRNLQLKASGSGSRNKDEESQPGSKQPKLTSNNMKQFFSNLASIETIDYNVVLQTRLERLLKFKAKYADLNNQWNDYWQESQFPNINSSIAFSDYIMANKKYNQLQAEFQLYGYQEPRHLELLKQLHQQKQKNLEQETIVILKQPNQIVFRNRQLSIQHLIYLSITMQPLLQVTRVEFVGNQLSDSSMKLLLCLLKEARHLNYLDLSQNHVSSSSSVMLCQMIKQFEMQLRVLKLAGTNMNTKQFLELCIALVESKIEELDFSQNEIDQNGYEAIETLLKYMKSLRIADFSHNNVLDTRNIRALWVKKHHSVERLQKMKNHYSGKEERILKI